MAKRAGAQTDRRREAAPQGGTLAGLRDVPVRITVELGRVDVTVEQALALAERSLLTVDRLADEPVDVRVNGRLFGRGRLVMVGDHYGVQLTELLEQEGDPAGARRLRP